MLLAGVPRVVVARRSGSLAPALQEGLARVAVHVDQGLSARPAHGARAAARRGDIHARQPLDPRELVARR